MTVPGAGVRAYSFREPNVPEGRQGDVRAWHRNHPPGSPGKAVGGG